MQMEHRLLLSYQCHCRLKCGIRDACCTHPHSSTFTQTSRMTKKLYKLAKHLFVGRFGVVNSKNGSNPFLTETCILGQYCLPGPFQSTVFMCIDVLCIDVNSKLTTFPMTGILNQFESGTRTRRWKNAGGEKVVFGFQQTTV